MPTAAKVIEATYDVPIIAHAPMEPLNAIAHVQADRVDVWVGTQNADAALTFAAQVSGVKPECTTSPKALYCSWVLLSPATACETSPMAPSW